MDLTFKDNGHNVLNIGEETDVTTDHSINATNEICMNDDENVIYK